MNDRIKKDLAFEIRNYMKHMSKESAVKKVKASHLGRINFIIDDVAKTIG